MVLHTALYPAQKASPPRLHSSPRQTPTDELEECSESLLEFELLILDPELADVVREDLELAELRLELELVEFVLETELCELLLDAELSDEAEEPEEREELLETELALECDELDEVKLVEDLELPEL